MFNCRITLDDTVGAVALALLFIAGSWLIYGVGMPGTEGL